MTTGNLIITILTVILSVVAACIAVIEWATKNPYKRTLWAWISCYWILQLIRELLVLFNY